MAHHHDVDRAVHRRGLPTGSHPVDDPDRPLSVTGGLTFAGGPGNNYGTHAVATLVDDVVTAVKDSGLRGRGGAGFPTGMKWGFIPQDNPKPKYLVVNADESEPGTCKDIPLMMASPHTLVEGVIISSFAIRANTAFIYVRGEVLHVIRRLQRAVQGGKLGRLLQGDADRAAEIVAAGGVMLDGQPLLSLDGSARGRASGRFRPSASMDPLPIGDNAGMSDAPARTIPLAVVGAGGLHGGAWRRLGRTWLLVGAGGRDAAHVGRLGSWRGLADGRAAGDVFRAPLRPQVDGDRAHRAGNRGCGDRNHSHEREGECKKLR